MFSFCKENNANKDIPNLQFNAESLPMLIEKYDLLRLTFLPIEISFAIDVLDAQRVI